MSFAWLIKRLFEIYFAFYIWLQKLKLKFPLIFLDQTEKIYQILFGTWETFFSLYLVLFENKYREFFKCENEFFFDKGYLKTIIYN